MAPKGLQEGPTGPQDGIKRAPGGPKLILIAGRTDLIRLICSHPLISDLIRPYGPVLPSGVVSRRVRSYWRAVPEHFSNFASCHEPLTQAPIHIHSSEKGVALRRTVLQKATKRQSKSKSPLQTPLHYKYKAPLQIMICSRYSYNANLFWAPCKAPQSAHEIRY